MPNHDKYRALQGVIYINSETRDYVWRDATGETYSGTVPETINVDDLSEKLTEPTFVASVLASIAPKSLPHLAASSDAPTTIEAIFELYQEERRTQQGAAAAYAKKLRDGYKPITAETAILSSSSSASSAQSSTTALNSSNNRKKTVSLNEKRDTFRKNSILERVKRAPHDLKSAISDILTESNSLEAAEQAIFNRLLQNQSLAVAWRNMQALFDFYIPSEQEQFRQ